MARTHKTPVPCEFNNQQCLCQMCERTCIEGISCDDCKKQCKSAHTIYWCTSFIGTYPWGDGLFRREKSIDEEIAERRKLNENTKV